MPKEKLSTYLNTGKYKRVRLVVHHGLGDAIMVAGDVLRSLRATYPAIEFFMDTHAGQQEIFGYPEGDYDLTYEFCPYCTEWDDSIPYTKAEYCALSEAGIQPPLDEDYSLPIKEIRNPLVACHWHSVCNDALSVPDDVAKRIWNTIIERGFVPINTTMDCYGGVPENMEWMSRRLSDLPPSVLTLTGVINQCIGYTGSPSGNFWVALATQPPQHILVITTTYHICKNTLLPVHEMHLPDGYNENIINQWMEDLRK